jgi:hypothetical protein
LAVKISIEILTKMEKKMKFEFFVNIDHVIKGYREKRKLARQNQEKNSL